MEKSAKDDELIDFFEVKKAIKSFLKLKSKPNSSSLPSGATAEATNTGHKPETYGLKAAASSLDSETIDLKKITYSIKKHSRWLIPLLCIIIAISFSLYFRTMPLRLPAADSWAEDSVKNFYSQQLEQSLAQQYPNLPKINLDILVDQEWQKAKAENTEIIQTQVNQLAEQYRSIFRDSEGTLYLLGIDPYYYYRQTEYILRNGFPGNRIKEGKLWDDYRLAPLGREAEWSFHNWFGAWWHRFLNWFGTFPLMYTFFFIGTIFSALTVIPGFFIGKRVTNNNVGGFFVAMLLAVSAFFVSRTTGESSDTDVYSVFFPVMITWLFLEGMYAKTSRNRFIYTGLAGLTTGIFAFAWTGWWYIATFIVLTFLFDLLYRLLLQFIKTKRVDFSSSGVRPIIYLSVMYIVSASVFVSLFTSFHQFVRVIRGPFQFLELKAVAVGSYWPNIRTTVAELNVTSFGNVLQQLGGKLFLALVFLAIIILIIRKEKTSENSPHRNLALPFFLSLWLIASLFATTKGVRFILQATPIFSIAVGSGIGLIWNYGSQWTIKELKLNSMLAKTIFLLFLALLLVQPVTEGYKQAFNSVPSMNDGWYDALSKIKTEAPQNIIITSWWDFGHWFKAIADRPVTFDGGTQTPWGAYWVGHSLLTADEKSAIGIMRMLNCGQNNAFEELNKVLNDTPESISLLNRILPLERNTAAQILATTGLTTSQIESVLYYTHCDNPPEDYFITSDDMVSKAGVWGHFGSWDFTKAVMHKETKNLPHDQAIAYLGSNFNKPSSEAEKIYSEVLTTEADRWISPWPSYLTGVNSCDRVDEETIHCSTSVQGKELTIVIGINSLTAKLGNSNVVPNSLVYVTPDAVKVQSFDGPKIGFSIILIPTKNNGYNFILADQLQADSMFAKLFFLEGHGLSCFSQFDDRRQPTGGRIITWKVDYGCKQENKVYFK